MSHNTSGWCVAEATTHSLKSSQHSTDSNVVPHAHDTRNLGHGCHFVTSRTKLARTCLTQRWHSTDRLLPLVAATATAAKPLIPEARRKDPDKGDIAEHGWVWLSCERSREAAGCWNARWMPGRSGCLDPRQSMCKSALQKAPTMFKQAFSTSSPLRIPFSVPEARSHTLLGFAPRLAVLSPEAFAWRGERHRHRDLH